MKAQNDGALLTQEELHTVRQWFESCQDTNSGFLDTNDYLVAERIYRCLSMTVPKGVSAVAKPQVGRGN